MDLGAYNGDVDVEAYDSSSNLIWSDTFTSGSDHVVQINGVGAIDYIMVFGGDREVFIDNVCIDRIEVRGGPGVCVRSGGAEAPPRGSSRLRLGRLDVLACRGANTGGSLRLP